MAWRGVYGVYNGPLLMYVGSTTCGIQKLESNHRSWKQKGYSRTKFREALISDGLMWRFVWLIQPYECDLEEIEKKEGYLIRLLNPQLNVDRDPVASSRKYGRYAEA